MKKAIIFVLLAYAISWGLWTFSILGQNGILPEWVQMIGQVGLFGPFFAYLIMLKIDKETRPFKQLFSKSNYKIILFVLLSPLVISLISYIVSILLNNETFSFGVSLASLIPTALFILLLGGPVEEFGWRGYLLPKLRNNYSFIITALILGLIHGLWHLPLHYLNGTVQEALPIYEFILITVATTVSYVFIYEYTKSLIPMILLHWFGNLSSAIFEYFYTQEGRYAIFVLTVILDIVLIVLINRRKKRII